MLLLLYLKYNNNQEISYMLGKTPHSYLMTFVDDKLLYKDDVKVNDNFEFSGLYLKGLEEGINSKNEVFLYDFINNEAKKISNSNYLPRDFNNKYIVCCSEDGVGSVELIDRDTGDIKIFSSK